MFERPPRKSPSLSLTPLIDIIFILLIFVILAANFDRVRALKVQLPQAAHSSPASSGSLSLFISSDGRFFLNGRPLSRSQLSASLKRARQRYSSLLIRSDRKTPLEFVVFSLDLAARFHFKDVSIATTTTTVKENSQR